MIYRKEELGTTVRQILNGWNRQSEDICSTKNISETSKLNLKGIVRGSGLSYGDAALNFNQTVYFLDLEHGEIEDRGESIVVPANLTIGQVCQYLLLSNRFLPTVPGSIDATIGGCLASDIHGKNDKNYGSFGHTVKSLQVLTHKGLKWVTCDSPEFKYYVANYGLTGIFTRIELLTRKINGRYLLTNTVIVNSLAELFESIKQELNSHEYAVGWMDYSTSSPRGYIESANWSNFENKKKRIGIALKVPKRMPNVINKLSIRIHNEVTFRKARMKSGRKHVLVSYENYLFPTISISNWNYLFGKNGFHEIQILVMDNEISGFEKSITRFAKKYPIFLAGFKRVEHRGLGLLSFTSKGWSIAINVPGKYLTSEKANEFLSELYSNFKAKQYLAKDSVLDIELFHKMYPEAQEFMNYRIENEHEVYFESEMSKRLGI